MREVGFIGLGISGHIIDDHSGIVQFYEQMAGIEVKTKEA